MEREEIEALAEHGLWKGKTLKGQLIETHISYVILSGDDVFKIKKPVEFSFLDFSTLERRKHFCEREVELNSRLTDIYLEVIPISKVDSQYTLGKQQMTDPFEFAVRMRKVDPELEMEKMLKSGRVAEQHIERLATTIARFHSKAELINKPFDIVEMEKDFNDIRSIKSKLATGLEGEFVNTIDKAILFTERFLNENQKYIEDRAARGFRRDLHGDFHSGNIFLTEKPIIFDCIEFNDEMRQIDILDEVAFFCMDLEAHQYGNLSERFIECYEQEMGLKFSEREIALFNYYKLYRANVRAKVHTLKSNFKAGRVTPYLRLMEKYLH